MNNLDVARRLSYIVFRLKDKNLSETQKIELIDEYDALYENFEHEMNLEESLKEYKKYKEKTRRVRRKILKLMVLGSCSFLTLTFNDDVLKSTTEETRRRYVSRFLKSLSNDYVANIDWGKQNGREHYHAVISGINFDMSDWEQYGFSDSRTIGRKDDECTSSKISKYIYKLSNHATKRSTRRKKIIYSRENQL